MRTASIVRCAAVGLLLVAASAWAHPQQSIDATIPPNAAGVQGGLYIWNANTQTSIWQESNRKNDNGMFAAPDGKSGMLGTSGLRNVLGLQLHNVCYGSFPPACDPAQGCERNCANLVPGPDCLNCHHGNYLFTYLPWGHFDPSQFGKFIDGTEAECNAWGAAHGVSVVFVPKDTFLYGQYDDETSHNNVPATQCFPAGYGGAP